MREVIIRGQTCILADDGKSLHKGDIYTHKVFLLSPSAKSEWEEVVAPPIPEPVVTPEEFKMRIEAIL